MMWIQAFVFITIYDKTFQKMTESLHKDKLHVYDLQENIEKRRKNVKRKYRHKK